MKHVFQHIFWWFVERLPFVWLRKHLIHFLCSSRRGMILHIYCTYTVYVCTYMHIYISKYIYSSHFNFINNINLNCIAFPNLLWLLQRKNVFYVFCKIQNEGWLVLFYLINLFICWKAWSFLCLSRNYEQICIKSRL